MEKSKVPRLKPSDPKVLELWVRAGGRCQFLGCNEYLLEDWLTRRNAKLADVAHIVAVSKDGPRGDDPLPMERRNDIENLMLACLEHHRLIDKKELAHIYTREVLTGYKIAHEERIKYLTGFGPDAETVIVRMVSNIRGDKVSISNEQVRESVLKCAGKYPRYLGGEHNIEIDLTGLPEGDLEDYFKVGMAKINEVVNRLVFPAVSEKKIRHISVFALARIPFLVHLGHMIGDKVPTYFYQKHRDGGEGWVWSNENEALEFGVTRLREGTDNRKVALMLSLSGKISLSHLPQVLGDDFSVYEIAPTTLAPHRSLISAKEHLDAFRKTYERCLRQIEHTHKPGELHLIPAIPAPAGIICGRELLKEVSPSLLVYERVGDDYKLATKIN